ncbi:23 kDa jasmonate-induced protein isoform X1 [Ziziphus jujuba]|uniref:23 kDa jasmonate-induced protein isoform X1 n=2 Tax=Ziziphus jujuba TaxID=326968 RepID=A0ABM3IJU1_ZIZJJ|nr:23 kDa jasmonate-induced protein isoform X1 [Ziziphus jujuba]
MNMGDGVFGNPITNSTLKRLPEFEDDYNITSIDRACVALNMKNAEEKNVRALQYLEMLKEKCGVDLGTLCLLYNATGDTIKLVTYKNWYGNIGASPYPMEIANGQWGAFLHVKKSPGPNSVGAVVYRGKDPTGVECDWMVSFDNPDNKVQLNTKAYTEVREIDHFLLDSTWATIYNLMQSSGYFHDSTKDKNNQKGCSLSVSIGNDHFPIAVAVFTLQDV